MLWSSRCMVVMTVTVLVDHVERRCDGVFDVLRSLGGADAVTKFARPTDDAFECRRTRR